MKSLGGMLMVKENQFEIIMMIASLLGNLKYSYCLQWLAEVKNLYKFYMLRSPLSLASFSFIHPSYMQPQWVSIIFSNFDQNLNPPPTFSFYVFS